MVYTRSNQPPGTGGNTSVLDLFEHLAASTWDWLHYARRLRLGFSEDTISDLTALKIARSNSGRVEVKRVTKRQEGIVGFDWMWLVHGPNIPLTGYVVQAKKMQLDQSTKYRYGHLKHRAAGGRYQIDALEDFANWFGSTPLYCFYNHVDNRTAQSYWHCRLQPVADVAQMGCTLVPLDHVRSVHDNRFPKDFRSVHQDPRAIPWRCLFHPNCAGSSLRSASERRSALSNDSLRALHALAERVSEDDGTLDVDRLIEDLDLEDIVNRYANGNFTPIPDRIVSIRLTT